MIYLVESAAAAAAATTMGSQNLLLRKQVETMRPRALYQKHIYNVVVHEKGGLGQQKH